MMHASKSRASILGTVLVAGLLVFVLTSTSVGASPLPAAANAGYSASYGVVKSFTVPPQTASNDWAYEGNATLGYSVTIYGNNTSSTTFELTVFRTMGFAYTVRFCDGSCSAPTQWANESYRAYEATATFANFTSQGKVLENGTNEVPAIALENTTSFLHANVTERTDVYLPKTGQLGPHLGYLGANLAANAAVSFSPALGLIPVPLLPGSTWNSTSEFTASGSAAWSYYYAMHRPVGNTIIGPKSGAASLSASGTVSVQGAYSPGSTFQYGGAAYPAISLTIIGPFDVREGVIFVPTSVDIFGAASQPWSDNQNGTASAQMATLDIKSVGADRLQLFASSWQYSSAASNAASSATVDPGSPGPSPAVASGSTVASGTLQGVPETSAQANGAQSCLTSGGGCPGQPGSAPRSFLGLIVVSGAVATVAVLVAVAVVSRRRQAPPPVYPNAALYPPGAAGPAAPATPGSPPPTEDDPLNHLW